MTHVISMFLVNIQNAVLNLLIFKEILIRRVVWLRVFYLIFLSSGRLYNIYICKLIIHSLPSRMAKTLCRLSLLGVTGMANSLFAVLQVLFSIGWIILIVL